MATVIKYENSKKLLFDGSEEGFYLFNNIQWSNLLNRDLSISLGIFDKNYFHKLESICNRETYLELLKIFKLKHSIAIKNLIEGMFGLPAYFKLFYSEDGKLAHVVVLSFGERNKGFFSVALEGVCDLDLT